jgi:hypothetical protein
MPSSSTLARRRRRRRRKRAKEMEKILVVSSSMYLIPEHIQININEAFVLISILYDVGFLFDLIEWFNLDDDDERKDGLEVFNFEDQVKLDTNWSIIRLDLGDSSWGGRKAILFTFNYWAPPEIEKYYIKQLHRNCQGAGEPDFAYNS